MADEQVTIDTGWENEPSLTDLQRDFTLSRTSHDAQVADVQGWLEALHIDSDQQKVPEGRSRIAPKLIRKNNEWRYASLTEPFLNTPDIFNVEPITFEDVDAARQNALVLNNQFNTKIDKVSFIDSYVRKAVDEGTVIVRVAWDTREELVTRQYPRYRFEVSDNLTHQEEINAAIQADPTTLPPEIVEAVTLTLENGDIHYPVFDGYDEEDDVSLIVNQPDIKVCDMQSIYIDPSCRGDLDKAEFVVHAFETSRSELEKAGIYENLEHIPESQGTNQEAQSAGNPNLSRDDGFRFSDTPRQKLTAYEYWGYWDVHGTGETRAIVATWVGNVLIRMEENPYPDGKIPFVAVSYLPVDGSVYGQPDAELIKDNQKVVTAVTRGIIDLMGRSANGQTGIRKGALDVVNRQRFDAGLDYEYNDLGDAQNSIFMHQFPEVPASAYNVIQYQQQEAESLSGVRAFANGITSAGLGETAAHVQGALSAAARRELGILRRLSEGLRKVGRKVIAMNQVFLREEEVVRVTNEQFVRVRRDDLEGNFDLRLEISSAEADEQKAQELSFMLQTTGQNFGLGMYQLILAEIADLRKMPELAMRIRQYQPEPNPEAQLDLQLKQLELQQAQVELQKTQAETQRILAEAGRAQALTDRANLDFIEQESGVNHARDVDRMQAQARGNIQLEQVRQQLNQNNTQSQDNQQ